MDLTPLALEVFNKYGAWGLILVYIVYKLALPIYRKRTGSWVSFRDLEKTHKQMTDSMQIFDARLTALSTKLERLESGQEQINKSFYAQLDKLHESISAARETIDRHFTLIMDAIRPLKGGR